MTFMRQILNSIQKCKQTLEECNDAELSQLVSGDVIEKFDKPRTPGSDYVQSVSFILVIISNVAGLFDLPNDAIKIF